MSTPTTVCSTCLGKRTDSRYRTCDKCRSRTRAYYRIRRQPTVPENTIPSNPPSNLDSVQNSTGLRPLAPADPPQRFEPNFLPNIHENTISPKSSTQLQSVSEFYKPDISKGRSFISESSAELHRISKIYTARLQSDSRSDLHCYRYWQSSFNKSTKMPNGQEKKNV